MIAKTRISGALLFVGEEGVGKKLFALELAKTFLCTNLQNGEACDACSACTRAEKFDLPKSLEKDDNEKIFFSEHSDVGLIRQAGKFITVNQMRDVEREANFRPYEAKARFFIIDQADKMNDAAANALLKTLEEPSSTSHLFLITSRPSALLPTIRSRCQMIRFAPIPTTEIERHLISTKKYVENDAKLLARLAHGSLGRAISLDLERFREQRESMLNVIESSISTKDRAKLLRVAEELCDAKIKDEYEPRLEILQTLIHDVLTLHLSAETDLINTDLQPKLAKFAEKARTSQLANCLTEIETLRENLTVNINRKSATDALFLKMASA